MPNDLFAELPVSEPAGARPVIPSGADRQRREALRVGPGAGRLALIAGGIGGALVLIAGSWAVSGGGKGAVPVVNAPSGPIRIAPENRGGMQVAGMNDPILSGDFASHEAALAPLPETPKPRALRTQIQAEGANSPERRHPPQQKKSEHAPVVNPEQATAPELLRAGKSVEEAVRRPTTAPAEPVPSTGALGGGRAAHHARAPVADGATRVQLAALSSEEAAKTEWKRMLKHMPELLAGRRPLFLRVEHDGHVFWRLRTGDFADHAKAAEFCAAVRSKGAECMVSSF